MTAEHTQHNYRKDLSWLIESISDEIRHTREFEHESGVQREGEAAPAFALARVARRADDWSSLTRAVPAGQAYVSNHPSLSAFRFVRGDGAIFVVWDNAKVPQEHWYHPSGGVVVFELADDGRIWDLVSPALKPQSP